MIVRVPSSLRHRPAVVHRRRLHQHRRRSDVVVDVIIHEAGKDVHEHRPQRRRGVGARRDRVEAFGPLLSRANTISPPGRSGPAASPAPSPSGSAAAAWSVSLSAGCGLLLGPSAGPCQQREEGQECPSPAARGHGQLLHDARSYYGDRCLLRHPHTSATPGRRPEEYAVETTARRLLAASRGGSGSAGWPPRRSSAAPVETTAAAAARS